MKTNKPTRNVGALLGFLLKGEVDAIFKQAPFEIQNGSDPILAWRQSAEAVRRLEHTPALAEVQILEPAECRAVEEVRARPTFKKYYESVADYQFALVPMDCLLSPQWYADKDYIAELSSQVPVDATLDQQICFAMAEGSITEPIISGGRVVFTSQRRDLHADPIPVWRQLESGEFEIVVRASSRPNYIQAAEIGNRILLTNGVHKACALFLRGHSRVPCLLRRVSRLEECGLGIQTSMLRPELLDGPRPAQVIDFLNEGVAVPVALRSMYQVLRVAVGVEALDVPAVPTVLTQVGSSDELGGRSGAVGDVAASTQSRENVNLQ